MLPTYLIPSATLISGLQLLLYCAVHDWGRHTCEHSLSLLLGLSALLCLHHTWYTVSLDASFFSTPCLNPTLQLKRHFTTLDYHAFKTADLWMPVVGGY